MPRTCGATKPPLPNWVCAGFPSSRSAATASREPNPRSSWARSFPKRERSRPSLTRRTRATTKAPALQTSCAIPSTPAEARVPTSFFQDGNIVDEYVELAVLRHPRAEGDFPDLLTIEALG